MTDASRRPAKTIADFWAIDTPETVAVVMKSDRPLTYTATRQENPRGVFLQFPDTGLDGMHSVYYPPPNPVLRSIRTAEGAGGSEARVLLELAQDAPYEVVPDSEGLKIVFQKPFGAAAFGGMPAISGTAAAPAKLPTATSKTEPGPPETAGAVPAPAAVLRDVRTEVRADAVLIRVTADGSRAARHRNCSAPDLRPSGEVLTVGPSAIRRAVRRRIATDRRAINSFVSRAFAVRCALGAVAMKSRFDRIREQSNWSIYQVISDRSRVLESSLHVSGRAVQRRRSAKTCSARAGSAYKPSKAEEFPALERDPAAIAAVPRAGRPDGRAWYVDGKSRWRRSAEGEEVQ